MPTGKTCAQCNGWGHVLVIMTPTPATKTQRDLILRTFSDKSAGWTYQTKATVCTACGGYGTR